MSDIKKLLALYREISLLGKIGAVLDWDLNVNLPQNAANGRAEQSAYITARLVDAWQRQEFRDLLQKCTANKSDLSEVEQAIVRNLGQSAKVYLKVPKELLVERSRTTSIAFVAWQKAKEENKFKDFAPHLEKIVRINQLIADHVGYKDNRYDALLDLYEPEFSTKDAKKIFKILTIELTKLIKQIQKSKFYDNPTGLEGKEFPVADQRQLSLFVLRRMGFDFSSGRMDISSHPFTTNLDRFDIRITNRYKLDDFKDSLMVAMHEGGHALYEQGINEAFDYGPLEGGVSLGIHESQSRFWENQVGRSKAFLHFLTPVMQAFYPDQLGSVDERTLVRHFNLVTPGLIRVEADEVTYNLHIALRFEVEEALINEKIDVSDLPSIWREKMKKYLGIEPKTDSQGVLQDVHWSYGSFGYFPTYTLGNLYAAQFTASMSKELPVESIVEKGELGTLLSWLRSNIHQHGGVYWPKQLVKTITQKPLDPTFFLTYLQKKYATLY